MKRLLTICLLFVCWGYSAKAQVDPHFSQFFVSPTWVNPAFTGAFDGAYRVTAVYRSQWADIAGGFKTMGVGAEVVTDKNVNVGANIFQQTTGTGYTYQNASISFAYTGVKLDGYKQITFALKGGFIGKRFDASKFQTEEQWNYITGYNAAAPSSEYMKTNNSMVFDAGAGILYYDLDDSKKVIPFIGISFDHINGPAEGFLSTSKMEKLPMRITAHASFGISMSDDVVVTPSLLYLSQGSASEKMLGVMVLNKVSDDLNLIGGINYRLQDAWVPFVGMQYGNMKLGASYDVNRSDLGKTISLSNSMEFSLSYIFQKTAKEDMRFLRCPQF